MCNNVKMEPKLLPVTGENVFDRIVNIRTEARLDIRSREFWVRRHQAFLRVFDRKAKRYLDSALKQSYTQNEKEEKRQ